MVNANSLFGGMLTIQGAAKKTNCDALGIPWEPRYMLIGDANGADPVPSASQTQLINQVYRAQLNQLRVSPTDDNILIAELVLPPDVGGWWIRELALEDKDGVFSAVANAAPSYKPLLAQGSGRNQVVRMHIITTGTANIQLKIDPSVVLATREYVDQKVLAELSKQDFKHSALVATTGPVVLSGLQTVDGVPLPVGARVLVKNQAAPNDNGLYSVAAGLWSRCADADSSLEVTPGLFVHVERGMANGDSIWQLVTDAPIALGATDLLFEMAAGRTGINAGTYRSVTVDKYGRVVGGTNPTTLAGYGVDPASQAEAEAATDQDNTKPMTALRVFQAIAKRVVQATETVFGWAKVATQAQTNSGADDTVMVTPKKMRFGFASSFNAQGYIVFPTWLGGIILQWTTGAAMTPGSAGAVYWPIAFPNACLCAIAVPRGSAGNSQAGNIVAGNISTVAADLYNWGPINTPSRIFAIGA
jgi:phage-related tail fiber protein